MASAAALPRISGTFSCKAGRIVEASQDRAGTIFFSLLSCKDKPPSCTALFFMGDSVEGTGDQVVDHFSNPTTIASILHSKLGPASNVWLLFPSHYEGPFACFQSLLPALTRTGEPLGYSPHDFFCSRHLSAMLQSAATAVDAGGSEAPAGAAEVAGDRRSKEAKTTSAASAAAAGAEAVSCSSGLSSPPTSSEPSPISLFGFSKGGVVLNQLLVEMAFDLQQQQQQQQQQQELGGRRLNQEASAEGKGVEASSSAQLPPFSLPSSHTSLLRCISGIHFIDAGLNCRGAHLTDPFWLGLLRERAAAYHQATGGSMQVVVHGTPRQWQDRQRRWIVDEKDRFVRLLRGEEEGEGRGGRRWMFAGPESKEGNEGRKGEGCSSRQGREGGDEELWGLQVVERMYFEGKKASMRMHFEVIEAMDLRIGVE